MNAREQAREAAWDAQAHLAMDDADIDGAADAASDVWEPIVRDLIALVALLATTPGVSLLSNEKERLDRAWEALG